MGAKREFRFANGTWSADSVADLYEINTTLGDEAFVSDEKVWYKYSGAGVGWLRMSVGDNVGKFVDFPVITHDAEVFERATDEVR